MSPRVVALLGVSGVGKSTFLRQASAGLSFQQLQASSLIRAAREAGEARAFSAEALRHSNIDENQDLLVRGFLRAVDPQAEVVVLDGHSVIDAPGGLVPVSPIVFKMIGASQVFLLSASPATILERRLGDTGRERPTRSLDELKAYQDASLLQAFAICAELAVPLHVITSDQYDVFSRLISMKHG